MDEDKTVAEDGSAPLRDRREVLKRGAVLGGAVVWATPVVQVLNISVADAASGEQPPPPPPPPLPPVVGLPSHGFFLLNCMGKLYGYQIIGYESDFKAGDLLAVNVLESPGQGNDVAYWESIGITGTIISSDKDPEWLRIRDALEPGAGVALLNGGQTLVVSATPPPGCTFVNAFIWDGSFGGDKVEPAVLIDGKYYFFI